MEENKRKFKFNGFYTLLCTIILSGALVYCTVFYTNSMSLIEDRKLNKIPITKSEFARYTAAYGDECTLIVDNKTGDVVMVNIIGVAKQHIWTYKFNLSDVTYGEGKQ